MTTNPNPNAATAAPADPDLSTARQKVFKNGLDLEPTFFSFIGPIAMKTFLSWVPVAGATFNHAVIDKLFKLETELQGTLDEHEAKLQAVQQMIDDVQKKWNAKAESLEKNFKGTLIAIGVAAGALVGYSAYQTPSILISYPVAVGTAIIGTAAAFSDRAKGLFGKVKSAAIWTVIGVGLGVGKQYGLDQAIDKAFPPKDGKAKTEERAPAEEVDPATRQIEQQEQQRKQDKINEDAQKLKDKYGRLDIRNTGRGFTVASKEKVVASTDKVESSEQARIGKPDDLAKVATAETAEVKKTGRA